MSTFRTRTLTAVVFVAVMLFGILWNEYSFFALFFCISFFALREYFQLIARINPDFSSAAPGHVSVALLAGCALEFAGSGNLFHNGRITGETAGWAALAISLVALILAELLLSKKWHPRNLGGTLLGLLYIPAPFALLIHLRVAPPSFPSGSFTNALPGYAIPLALILSMWANDTMAYITGSLIGRTKFFPAISPKKTWEGTLGGIILTMVVAAVFSWLSPYHSAHWVAIAGIAAVTGTAGDLLESKIKRMAGVKDSGNIMPGHGGFMDRFDSLIVATPFVWAYLLLCL